VGISGLYGSAGHLAECPDLGPQCKNTPPPVPYYHHVGLWLSDITADVSYGLTPAFAIEGRLLLRVVDTMPTYTELDGSPKLVPNDIHHHDRTMVGPGDPWLVLRSGGAIGKFMTAARFGVSFPVGRTEPDPFKLGAEGKWHEHIMLGTGTFMPIVGIGLSYPAGPVELSASALGIFSVYENKDGFRAPSRMFGGLRAAYPIAKWKLSPHFAVDLAHESAEIWDGSYALEGFNARTDLLAGAGVTWEFASAWKVEATFRALVLRLTDAPAFNYPGIGQLSVSHSWDLVAPTTAPKKDEHEEDEDDHAH
jgi:hypothetical protein